MLYRGHTATIVRTRITIHKNCCLSHQGMRWYHYTIEHLRTNSQPFLYFNIIIIVHYLADTYRPWSITNNRTKTSTKHIKTRWVVSTILPTWFTALLHRYVANISSMKDIVASYKYAYQFVTIECRSVSINKLNCVKFVFCDEPPACGYIIGDDISFAIANCSPSLTAYEIFQFMLRWTYCIWISVSWCRTTPLLCN